MCLYFGTDRKYDDVEHHTIIFGDTYQELLQRIFDGGAVGDDLSLYLHRPTATDPALAPQGKDAFYVLAPVPNLKRNDWHTVKAQVKERGAGYIGRTCAAEPARSPRSLLRL